MAVEAAEITTAVVSDKQFIIVDGEFQTGDDKKFKNLAITFDDAVVLLNSEGGLAQVGMEIGRTIAIKGFSTAVGANGLCASSCGLVWLAGHERFLTTSSRIGFHAIYTVPDGKPEVSSDGNAIVGGYLRQLGFSDPIIIYVTQAVPNSMHWLSISDANRLGLSVTLSPDAASTSAKISNDTPVETKTTAWHAPISIPRPEKKDSNAVTQTAIFYEQASTPAKVDQFNATVVWSTKQQPNVSGKTEYAVVGYVTIPQKRLAAEIILAPNHDTSIPASHFITLHFQYLEEFDDDKVEDLRKISMKRKEPDIGQPLIGVPAKLDDGYFVFALNGLDNLEQKNLSRIKKNSWIDIAFINAGGRRGLITLYKGLSGNKAFSDAISSWR